MLNIRTVTVIFTMFSFRQLVESMESSTSIPCADINKSLLKGTRGNDRDDHGWRRRVKKECDGFPGHTTVERDSCEGSESGMPAREKGGLMEMTEYGGKGEVLEGTSVVCSLGVSGVSTGADGVLGGTNGTSMGESIGKETRKSDVNDKSTDIVKEESVDLSHTSTPHPHTLTWKQNHPNSKDGDAHMTVKEEPQDMTESSVNDYSLDDPLFSEVCPSPPSTMSQVTTHSHNRHCHHDAKYRVVSQYHDRTTNGMTLVPSHDEQRHSSTQKDIPTKPICQARQTPGWISNTLAEPFTNNQLGHSKHWNRDARDHRIRCEYKHNVFLRDHYNSRRGGSNILTEENGVSNSVMHGNHRHALPGREGDGAPGSFSFTTDVPINLRLSESSGSSHTRSPSSNHTSSVYPLKSVGGVEGRRWDSVEQSWRESVKGASAFGTSLSAASQHTQDTPSSERTKHSNTSRNQDASLYRYRS